MMKAMVRTCAAWMRAGMPLKLMKIVIYVNNLKNESNNSENERLMELFSELKTKLEATENSQGVIMLV